MEELFKYDNMIASKLLSSASLCKLCTKLSKCLNTHQNTSDECACECKTNPAVRRLIIRMAGFLSGFVFVCVLTSVFRVCDADVFCDETASAHQTLCSQVETLEIQFFSEVSRDHLDEKECVFMMEVLSVRSLLPHLTSSSYATRPTAGLRWTRVC